MLFFLQISSKITNAMFEPVNMYGNGNGKTLERFFIM